MVEGKLESCWLYKVQSDSNMKKEGIAEELHHSILVSQWQCVNTKPFTWPGCWKLIDHTWVGHNLREQNSKFVLRNKFQLSQSYFFGFVRLGNSFNLVCVSLHTWKIYITLSSWEVSIKTKQLIYNTIIWTRK